MKRYQKDIFELLGLRILTQNENTRDGGVFDNDEHGSSNADQQAHGG